MRVKSLLKSLDKALKQAYFSKYQAGAKREYLEIEDLFMILTFSKLYGLDNPYEYELAPLLPYLMDHYHAWHKRMGQNTDIFEHFPCAGCC